MAVLPDDPLQPGGIAAYGERLRKGEVTAEAVTRAYLERIAVLDPKLQAFEHVAGGQALAQARAIDGLIAAGVDLGPLMGVPVAVKDLLAVDGMPVTGGSNVDVSDLVGAEGGFVKTLKRCGCIILGKATLVEFAFGALGINLRRTPWNPWDAATHRLPGGSSSGSGVAVAAGLCGFAIGSDTGGSVRLPASFCGTYGLRTVPGLWPGGGFLPLVPTLDTLGPLTKSAEDAAIVMGALTGRPAPTAAPLDGLRLGRPEQVFYDDLDENVEKCVAAVLADLEKAGVEIVPVDLPETRERETYFPMVMPVNAIAVIGRERFQEIRDRMDPTVASRCAAGLDVQAAEYLRMEQRRAELCRIATEKMQGLDGWVTPTIAMTAPPVADFDDVEKSMRMTFAITQATQPGSMYDLCASSSPIHMYGSDLPVGLHVLCPRDRLEHAVAIGLAIEEVTGPPPAADMGAFL